MRRRSRIARMRAQAGFKSAKSAATQLEVSTVHLHNIERGAAGASEPLIEKMSKLFDFPIDRIRAAIREQRKYLLKRMHRDL